MESINDIIPKEYKSRPFLTGTTKVKAPRSIDRYSDDPNTGRGNGVAIETEGDKIVIPDAFVQAVWADNDITSGRSSPSAQYQDAKQVTSSYLS